MFEQHSSYMCAVVHYVAAVVNKRVESDMPPPQVLYQHLTGPEWTPSQPWSVKVHRICKQIGEQNC